MVISLDSNNSVYKAYSKSCKLVFFDELEINLCNLYLQIDHTSSFCQKLLVVCGRCVVFGSLCYLSAMARMPTFRRLMNGELMLGYTREADEVFKKNSEKNEPQIIVQLIRY